MTNTLLSVLLLAAPVCALAQLPEMYKTVDRITWVVKDLDRVTGAWEKLGISEVRQLGEIAMGAGRVRVAAGRLGDAQIDWMQPLEGTNALSAYLAKHGDSVFGLMHRAPTVQALNQEVERLRGLGVGTLERGTIETEAGTVDYAYLDTIEKGKYALGLIAMPETAESVIDVPANPAGPKLTQFAFVARDTRAVSAFWSKLGFPEMSYTHGATRNPQYRGQPGRFDHELGWQRHGKVTYEWILPLRGPTVYEEFLKAHGEGLQHFGVAVEDMDKAIAGWKRLGYAVSQSGGWGEEGKAGSGRFAYIDLEAVGGLTLELLWNYR